MMRAIMLSRLPDMRLGPKRKQMTALERLYAKLPQPRLMVSESEAEQRKFWKLVSNRKKV